MKVPLIFTMIFSISVKKNCLEAFRLKRGHGLFDQGCSINQSKIHMTFQADVFFTFFAVRDRDRDRSRRDRSRKPRREPSWAPAFPP